MRESVQSQKDGRAVGGRGELVPQGLEGGPGKLGLLGGGGDVEQGAILGDMEELWVLLCYLVLLQDRAVGLDNLLKEVEAVGGLIELNGLGVGDGAVVRVGVGEVLG